MDVGKRMRVRVPVIVQCTFGLLAGLWVGIAGCAGDGRADGGADLGAVNPNGDKEDASIVMDGATAGAMDSGTCGNGTSKARDSGVGGGEDSGVTSVASDGDAGRPAEDSYCDAGTAAGGFLADAGTCTDDRQCPGGYECEFRLTHCPSGGRGWSADFGTIVPGACYASPGGLQPGTCHSGADCRGPCISQSGTWQCDVQDNTYVPEDFCTVYCPCDAGECHEPNLPTFQAECPPDAGCRQVTAPNSEDTVCVCPGVTCLPDGGLLGWPSGN